MKKVIILLVALVWMNGAIAQPCLPEGITFTTQAQIDNFQINYPGCTEIEGRCPNRWLDDNKHYQFKWTKCINSYRGQYLVLVEMIY